MFVTTGAGSTWSPPETTGVGCTCSPREKRTGCTCSPRRSKTESQLSAAQARPRCHPEPGRPFSANVGEASASPRNRMNSYAKRAPNPCGMRTCKIIGLKASCNEHLQKNGGEGLLLPSGHLRRELDGKRVKPIVPNYFRTLCALFFQRAKINSFVFSR
jgi:hypothetical protein